ncbi:Hypothetical protein SRAE_1000013700 [Strongyloides ratti]|uniref:Uncharacterized protein n=1 Tax=Strongyloides ratti TaxID=34506 RepID=A0A090KWR5_STRRB|nr:Hypothetical protein SRAE_1000013700 [Strongyloides ratti]CEF61861.1 Hypothetical protein SRAE_1000013700 [Strongyloides ratti]
MTPYNTNYIPVNSQNLNDEVVNFFTEDSFHDASDAPVIGTDNLEMARSGIPNSLPKNIPYGEIKYILYFINSLMLLLNLVFISIIINSAYSLKYSPIKRKRNEIVQEYLKVGIEKCNNYNNYDKLKQDIEKLKKSIDKKDRNIINKTKIDKDRQNNKLQQLPIVQMNEEKLAEVFHILAKMPNEKSDSTINKNIINKNVIMIREDETMCILNHEDNKKQINDKNDKTSKSLEKKF